MLTINFDCNSWQLIHSKSNHWSDRFQGSFDAIALYLCRLSLSFTVFLVSSFFLLMSHVPVVDVVSDRSIRVLHLLVLYFFSFICYSQDWEELDFLNALHTFIFPASVWMFYGVSSCLWLHLLLWCLRLDPFGFCFNAILFTSWFSWRERKIV